MSTQRYGSITSRAVIGEFWRALEQGPVGWVNSLAFPVMSNQESEEYGWLGQSPAMREWIGGRQAKRLREVSQTVKNVKYEATLEVSVDDVRRDKTGQIMIRAGDLADRTNSHKAKLLSTQIEAGESTVCYDGEFFFDTSHSEGDSGTQSNDIQVDISTVPVGTHGSITNPSVGEFVEAMMEGVQQIVGFVDDQGEPMNENAMDFTVMVPTSLWKVGVSALTSNTIDQGDTNVIANMNGLNFNIVPNARLSWTDKFAVFRTDGRVKPFIMQEEMPVDLSAVAEGSELEFNEDIWRFGVKWLGAPAYGYWQHACLVTMI